MTHAGHSQLSAVSQDWQVHNVKHLLARLRCYAGARVSMYGVQVAANLLFVERLRVQFTSKRFDRLGDQVDLFGTPHPTQ